MADHQHDAADEEHNSYNNKGGEKPWAVTIASDGDDDDDDDDDDGSDDDDESAAATTTTTATSATSSSSGTVGGDEDDAYTGHTPNAASLKRKRSALQCPYLDSIDRTMLDFDFNKQCCVTLATLNVYACLVCGKYFQGRSTTSPAQLHSLQADHHVFLNLHTSRIYCLPDGYEVIDSSLDDIKYYMRPTYTPQQIELLDRTEVWGRALDGSKYLSGVVGMNNVKANDGIGVILQVLQHISPLRDFFLREANYELYVANPLICHFGELVRKVWSPKLFKKQVSPQELLQDILTASKRRFTPTTQCDPAEFTSWFLTSLHTGLGGTKKMHSSIVHHCFQGVAAVNTYTKINKEDPDEQAREDATEDEKTSVLLKGYSGPQKSTNPFLFLSLDVPPPPLFKSESEKNIIPQIPLFVLLNKFNGKSVHHNPVTGERKQFSIRQLPHFLIFHIKRFSKNQYFSEKNPTIVNFPVKGLDMKDYISDESAAVRDTQYDLVANVFHEGASDQSDSDMGFFKAHVLHHGSSKWFEVQDLLVTETQPQYIVLSAAYLLVYERRLTSRS